MLSNTTAASPPKRRREVDTRTPTSSGTQRAVRCGVFNCMMDEFQLRNVAESELRPGEKVLWVARASPIRLALPYLVILGFGVPWTASSIGFMITWHKNSGLGVGDILFQGSFVAVGLGMMAAPIWAYIRGRKTMYALTDRRILMIVAGNTKKVNSYDETQIGNIERVERADGSGDLTFAKEFQKDSEGSNRSTDVKFVGIPDVRSVEDLVRKTFKKE